MSDHTIVLKALDELMANLKHHRDDWENPTLDDYLEATRAWLNDWQKNYSEPLTWELVARLFIAGKSYE